MTMTSWFKLWIPFSNTAKQERREVKSGLKEAQNLHVETIIRKEDYEKAYEEHKKISDALRAERRKNHFSELFLQVPTKSQKDDV